MKLFNFSFEKGYSLIIIISIEEVSKKIVVQ